VFLVQRLTPLKRRPWAELASSAWDSLFQGLQLEVKPASPGDTVQLALPLNVGIAFVPGNSPYGRPITAVDRQQLLQRVRDALAGTDSVERIEAVPETFVPEQGGFEQRGRSSVHSASTSSHSSPTTKCNSATRRGRRSRIGRLQAHT
jgi:hypothetical protein